MSLPLVDFINAERVPAIVTRLFEGDYAVSAGVRTLNAEQSESGSRTMVVEFTRPLRLPAGYWTCDVEVLVLVGQLDVDGKLLERYGYLFVPAGVALGPVSLVTGEARALVFASGSPRFIPSVVDKPGAARHRFIGPLHAGDLPWEYTKTKGFPAGAGRKTLRDDPEVGESFWLLGLLPHWNSQLLEWHTFAEENVVLEGEIQTAAGLMTPGCYLAHPSGPDTVHGPMRSRPGALLVTRAVGPLGTTYQRAAAELIGDWR